MVLLSAKTLSKSVNSPHDFVHDPLDISQTDSVRLLRVLGSKNGQIYCSLHHTYLSEAKYYALSYVWGPEGRGRKITVNGKAFRVRKNLFNFLKRVTQAPFINLSMTERSRREKDSRTLFFWIDAICLDQTNVSERNHQVQQMHKIYEKARAIFAWLGCGDPQLEQWLSGLSFRAEYGVYPNQRWFDNQEQARERFFNLEYWSRLWVAQEFGLASSVFLMFGTQFVFWTLPWDQLDHRRGSWETWAQIHYEFRERRQMNRSLLSFESLFDGFSELQCADPRDRIYGLLALARDGRNFRVDYNEDLLQLATRVVTSFPCEGLFFLGTVLRSLSLETHVLEHFARPMRNTIRHGNPHQQCPKCGFSFAIEFFASTDCLVVCTDLLKTSGHTFYFKYGNRGCYWLGPLTSEEHNSEAEGWFQQSYLARFEDDTVSVQDVIADVESKAPRYIPQIKTSCARNGLLARPRVTSPEWETRRPHKREIAYVKAIEGAFVASNALEWQRNHPLVDPVGASH